MSGHDKNRVSIAREEDPIPKGVRGHKRQALKRSIKSRHMFMIALAGVIGTGLFLGTGDVINRAGPGGTIAAYVVGGFLLWLTMSCLGETSSVMPASGSFQAHATKLLGPGTGFTIGWIYWLSWASFIGLEFLAAGIVMKFWFPDVPTAVWSGVFIVVLFVINLFSVRGFAEVESGLAFVKVAAVAAFIVIGGLVLVGVLGMDGETRPRWDNFYADGGFFPTGIGAVLAAMMTVIYTFMGSEVMGVAAGEAENPAKAVPKAVRTIVFRLVFLYLGAVVILIALIPWRQAGLSESPFVTVFEAIGIPFAADIMNFVVLVSILSVGNTGLYMCSRILWSLGHDGHAPKFFTRTLKNGSPYGGLIFTMVFGLLSLLSSFVAEDTLFVFLMSVSGIGGALSWITIALTQYSFRIKFVKSGGDVKQLPYRVPLFPAVPILVVLLNLAVFVGMALDPTQRLSLVIGLGVVPVCYGVYWLFIRPREKHLPSAEMEVRLPAEKV
ncbi:Amino-acid permease RocC [Brevibacterium ravenspurgense]|uniref:Amino-acid permease RocC n=2 Tax=Brevibacterium TaxID=1696 RepID=A0A150H5H9_9MICO|nr:amino acid permease [Brevibacterium ravenspurgense]KXZ57379.1 Amino-acid permease RocC [Brevibacterium ravenspurgense]